MGEVVRGSQAVCHEDRRLSVGEEPFREAELSVRRSASSASRCSGLLRHRTSSPPPHHCTLGPHVSAAPSFLM